MMKMMRSLKNDFSMPMASVKDADLPVALDDFFFAIPY